MTPDPGKQPSTNSEPLNKYTSLSVILKRHNNIMDRLIATDKLVALQTANIVDKSERRSKKLIVFFSVIEASFKNDPSSIMQIGEALQRNEPDVRSVALDGIASLFNPQIRRVVLKGGPSHYDEDIKYVLDLLEGTLDREFLHSVTELAYYSFSDHTSRYYDERSSLIVKTLVEAPDATVWAHAFELLRLMKCMATVDGLISALDTVEKFDRRQIQDLLRDITGKRFLFGKGTPDQWKEWWVKNKDSVRK